MATYKTKSIILSSYPYKEHDRIITFYSKEFGKMDARARGARKITSKLAGHLEPFIETELLLANGRRWDILAGSRTIKTNQNLRSDYLKLAAASVCVEAVKNITKPLSSDARVFQLLRAIISELELSQSKSRQKHLVATFLWQLLGLSGFKAELDHCIQCRISLSSGSFSFEGGGVLCHNCARQDMMAHEAGPKTIAELRAFTLTTKEAQAIAKQFWERIVDFKPLNSLQFFELITI